MYKRHHDSYPPTRLYRIWSGMKNRVHANDYRKANYVRKGIKLCDEWKEYIKFKEWALGNGYDDNLTIDRIDNNGDYCPSNCRWTTCAQQMRNTSYTVMIEHDGRKMCMWDWAKEVGVNYYTVNYRWHKGIRNFDKLFAKYNLHNQKELELTKLKGIKL